MVDKKEITRIVLTMVLSFTLIGGLVVAVYAYTKPIIDKNITQQTKAKLKAMFPEADSLPLVCTRDGKDSPTLCYRALKNNLTLGYVISAGGKGYSSIVKVLASVDTLQKIRFIGILSHAETPGLGDVILSKPFAAKFPGATLATMHLVKAPATDGINGVTGATFSSRAVVHALNEGLQTLHDTLLKDK